MISKTAVFYFMGNSNYEFGGMERHEVSFISYCKKIGLSKSNVCFLVKKSAEVTIEVISTEDNTVRHFGHIKEIVRIAADLSKDKRILLFFNSGHWIEEVPLLRARIPSGVFIQRSGGNEIIQASLKDMSGLHSDRLSKWVEIINSHVDSVIINSAFAGNRLEDAGILQDKLALIPGGVDTDYLRRMEPHRNTLRKRLGHNHQINISIACRFVPFKNVCGAVEALRRLFGHYDFHFFLAGDGPERHKIVELADAALGKERYTMLGCLSYSETLRLLVASDAVLCSSILLKKDVPGGSYHHTESMSRTIFEAICSGSPVAVTPVGGMPEFITHDIGAVANDCSSKAIAESIGDAMKIQIDNGTLETLRNRYCWATVFKKYECLINRFFEKHG